MHISNKILTNYLRAVMPGKQWIDMELAYRFSMLVQAMILKPGSVNWVDKTLEDEYYTPEDWDLAILMAKAVNNTTDAIQVLNTNRGLQTFYRDTFDLDVDGIAFNMPAQATFQLWLGHWGGQIKITSARNLAEFVKMAGSYDYDRERAWAMDVANTDQDLIIGVSKKNFKVFMLPIKRGDPIHQEGQYKYKQLALQLHRDINS